MCVECHSAVTEWLMCVVCHSTVTEWLTCVECHSAVTEWLTYVECHSTVTEWLTCVVCSAGGDWIVDLLSARQCSSDWSLSEISDDESSLLQQIEANYSAASELYAADVGALCWVDALQMHVAFFLLNAVTDPRHRARSRLPAGPQIHQCDVDTVHFTRTHSGRVSSTTYEREREFMNLCSFLCSLSYSRVYVFPSEQLLCRDSAVSVSDRLRLHLLMSTARATAAGNTAAASLVFVCSTSSSSVVHCRLLGRVVNYAQAELLTAGHSVYIVTDVGLAVGLHQLDALVKPTSSRVRSAVYSAAKPLFSPVSCVVIALHLSST